MLGDLEGPCTPGDSSVAAQPRLLSPGLHRTPYKPEVQMGALRRVYRLTYSFRAQVPRGLAPGQGRGGGQGRRPLWLGSNSHPCASRGFIPHLPTTQASWTLVAIETLASDLNKGRLAAAPSSSDLLGTDCLNSDLGRGVPTKSVERESRTGGRAPYSWSICWT